MDTPTSRPTRDTDSTGAARRRLQVPTWIRDLQIPARLRRLQVPDCLRDPGSWFVAAATAVFIAVGTGMLWLLWQLVTAVGAGLEHGGHAVGDGLGRLAGWVTSGPITTSIVTPVRAYLDSHATGLPATSGDLWLLWLTAVSVLFLAAVCGSVYARIGWAVIGALTTAAVWAGTTAAASRPLAAGITVTAWLLLSLIAYAGRVRINLPDLPGRPLFTRPAAATDDDVDTDIPTGR